MSCKHDWHLVMNLQGGRVGELMSGIAVPFIYEDKRIMKTIWVCSKCGRWKEMTGKEVE